MQSWTNDPKWEQQMREDGFDIELRSPLMVPVATLCRASEWDGAPMSGTSAPVSEEQKGEVNQRSTQRS